MLVPCVRGRVIVSLYNMEPKADHFQVFRLLIVKRGRVRRRGSTAHGNRVRSRQTVEFPGQGNKN